jgi:hypothetical protein
MAFTDNELIEIIDRTMGFNLLSSVELFTLRVLLHDNDPAINLEKDLHDLAHFPERLITSHKDEWIAYCRKHLFMACKQKGIGSAKSATNYLQATRELLSDSNENLSGYAARIDATEAMLKSDNVALLESPASREIRKLIG